MKNKASIFYGGYLSRAGGAFFHARNMKDGLKKLNWDVDIITLDSLPLWCRYTPFLIERAINYFSSPLGFIYKGKVTKFLFKFFFNTDRDLFIFEDIYLAWNSQIPSVTILHAVWSDNLQAFKPSPNKEARFRRHEVNLINSIEHSLITVSAPYKNYIHEAHFKGKLTKSIDVVELGIDISKSNNLRNKRGNSKSIIFTGSLEARKNLLFLLDILEQLFVQDKEFSLTIVGDGPDRSKLDKLVSSKNLPVRFLGKLDYSEVIKELPKHGTYVHTSTKESFSFSLLEAKLAGLKTFAYGGLEVPPEFIDKGLNSFEVKEWVSALILDSGKINYVNADKYSIESMVQKTLNIIQ